MFFSLTHEQKSNIFWTIRRWWHKPEMYTVCCHNGYLYIISFTKYDLSDIKYYKWKYFKNDIRPGNWWPYLRKYLCKFAIIFFFCPGDFAYFKFGKKIRYPFARTRVSFCEWLENKARYHEYGYLEEIDREEDYND